MDSRETLLKLAQDIEIDYGDILRKSELIDLFGIERAVIKSEMGITDIRKALNNENWAFVHCMELFRMYLQDERKMYLVALGKEGQYRVIRPDQHVDQALSYFKKTVNKAFSESQKILDSCRVELLNSAEKMKLTEAKVNVSNIEHLINKQSLINKALDDKEAG